MTFQHVRQYGNSGPCYDCPACEIEKLLLVLSTFEDSMKHAEVERDHLRRLWEEERSANDAMEAELDGVRERIEAACVHIEETARMQEKIAGLAGGLVAHSLTNAVDRIRQAIPGPTSLEKKP